MTTASRIATPVRWIVLGLSFPIGGLIVFTSLGPVTTPGLALGGGALAGLVIGAAEAWALRLPLPRWTLATSVGLAAGSLLAALVTPLLGEGVLSTIAGALVSGVVTAGAQLLAGPPLAPPIWLAVRTAAWIVGWVVSLFLAINTEQGFIVFGSTGALVFVVAMFLTTRFGRKQVVA
jgi:hypothetical protein